MKEAKRGKEGETERIAMMTGEDAREIEELSVYVDDTTQPTVAQPRSRWWTTRGPPRFLVANTSYSGDREYCRL
ncbi:MAG: hypothetical protein U0236_13275 [Nitrospira sp.]